MFEKAKPGRDAFTFSLRGVRAVAPFAPAPAIEDDRLNKAYDERSDAAIEDQLDAPREIPIVWGRWWMLRRLRRAA